MCCACAAQALHDECLRGAKFVSRLLEALGAEVKMAQPYDGKNPVVLGRLGNNPAHPTGEGHAGLHCCEQQQKAVLAFGGIDTHFGLVQGLRHSQLTTGMCRYC